MTDILKSTCDRKTKFWGNQRNTFGLLPGPEGTCPMATFGPGGCCDIKKNRKNPACYVYNTMSCFNGVRPALKHNTDALKQASVHQKTKLLVDEFRRFRAAELQQDTPRLLYRIHWSGDIFDSDYLIALRTAMSEFPDIHFWCYTRSLPFVQWLAENTPNLTLYISLDKSNLLLGLQTYYAAQTSTKNKGNLQICYMSDKDDFVEQYRIAYHQNKLGDTMATLQIQHYPIQAIVFPVTPPTLKSCPVDDGKLELEYGCSRCGKCVSDRKNWKPTPVWFKS